MNINKVHSTYFINMNIKITSHRKNKQNFILKNYKLYYFKIKYQLLMMFLTIFRNRRCDYQRKA